MSEEQFPGLTAAQIERLALLSEELGEAQHMIGKVLRHGYDSINPVNPGPTNREALGMELGHVRAAIAMLTGAGDLSATDISRHGARKLVTVQPWLHHQDA
jgi:hypothetical protein